MNIKSYIKKIRTLVFNYLLFSLNINIFLFIINSSEYKNVKQKFNDFSKFLSSIEPLFLENCKSNVLWIDHSFGGGTESYTKNIINRFEKEKNILRLQYNIKYSCYIVSVNNSAVCFISNYCDVLKVIDRFLFSEIEVNSLVGWNNIGVLLNYISVYKIKNPKTVISYHCHDFFCICPSLNLLNCDHRFCNLSYKSTCDVCFNKIRLSHEYIFPSVSCLEDWRNMWKLFFEKSVDDIVLFSHSSEDLFERVYSTVKSKVNIIPHKINKLPKVNVEKHNGLNIAFLGNITTIPKGREIVTRLVENNKDKYIKFFVIGEFRNAPKELIVSGRYCPNEIPLLVKKYGIDIIFISSICPETFSYTTAESISMGIPVVCYNLGAQAEQVSKYYNGLVLNSVCPCKNLDEIRNFVNKNKESCSY